MIVKQVIVIRKDLNNCQTCKHYIDGRNFKQPTTTVMHYTRVMGSRFKIMLWAGFVKPIIYYVREIRT